MIKPALAVRRHLAGAIGSVLAVGMRIALFALVALSAAVVPALGETGTSEWKEARFLALSEHVFNVAGVKVSNCHMEYAELGSMSALPKCYVLNTSQKTADVRVDFVVLNEKGETILSTTLSQVHLADMTGGEMMQNIPISKEDFIGTKTARVRIWASTRR